MTGRILFLDTETTGLPRDGTPIEFSGNPVPIEVAGVLCEHDTPDSRRNIFQAYVGFNDVACDPGALKAHGITDETRRNLGLPPAWVLEQVIAGFRLAHLVVGHNIKFDLKMLRIAAYRADNTGRLLVDLDDCILTTKIECTLQLATSILRLPPTARMSAAGFTKFKPPNLGEAYRFFFSKDFAGAHGALADCLAARDVYYAIKAWQAKSPAAQAVNETVSKLNKQHDADVD